MRSDVRYMNLHEFLSAAASAGYLITIEREVDPHLEVARVAAELDGRPVLFTRVKGSAYPILIGACSDRRYFGLALSTPADQVMFRLADALAAPQPVSASHFRSDRHLPAEARPGHLPGGTSPDRPACSAPGRNSAGQNRRR